MTNSDGYVKMWHIMEALQTRYVLTQQMINLIQRSDNSTQGNAAAKKMYAEVKDFLDKGADADGMPGASMLRPLHAAAKMGKSDIVQLLVDAGAEVNTMDAFNNRTPLHYAAEANVEVVRTLLKCGSVPDVKDADGNTPLHWASYKNKYDSVECLLLNEASVNNLNRNRDTALSFAAMRGNAECVRILLDHGADVRIRNHVGKTALIRAASMNYNGFSFYDDDICFDLLLRASGRLILKAHPAYEESNISPSDKDVYQFLVSIASQVPTLSSLCRAAVRHNLVNRHIPNAINALRLPRDIKRFLLLLDER